jgi:hypothetical protein
MGDLDRFKKKILVVDFDGVIHGYQSGWVTATFTPDPPVEGAMEWLYEMSKEFDLRVFSARSDQEGGIQAMATYIKYWAEKQLSNVDPDYKANGLINRVCYDGDAWPKAKPPGFVTLDDRVICFRGPGTWPTVEELKAFKPWNK